MTSFAVCGTIKEKKEVAMKEKNQHLNIRVSAEELEQIKAKAEEKHLSISAYVRMTLLSGGRDDDRA